MKDIALDALPTIALRGITPLPSNIVKIEIGRDLSQRALEMSEKSCKSLIVLVIQKTNNENVTINDIESIGVLARIYSKERKSQTITKVDFEILHRVKIEEFMSVYPYLQVIYSPFPTIFAREDEQRILFSKALNEVASNAPILFVNHREIKKGLSLNTTPEAFCDYCAFNLKTDKSKYRFLKEAHLSKRLEYLLEEINYEKNIVELENKINQEVKRSIDESQKEYYLREKMKAIQNELGDKARQEEDIDRLRKKITESGMPKDIMDKCLDELRRYTQASPQMAESSVIRSYLDFMTDLPWKEETKDSDDLAEIITLLDKNHYGLDLVKERIIEYLAVKIMTKKNPQTILCLVGPPGVGKTSLAFSIAGALKRKFIKVSLGGVRDESEIRGHRRTYLGALPGRILKGMKDAKVINPIFLLDEVDKMTSDMRGDPASALLEVLDPEQNQKFSDNYAEESYDLSKVMFITTANDLSRIPGPLRDRMEIIELSSYTEFEKFNIAVKHLIPKQLENHGLTADDLKINDDVIYHLIRHYTREAGVRELDRIISTICRRVIRDILISKTTNTVVTLDNLNKYMIKMRYQEHNKRKENLVGVVIGLAYTQFGGDTMDIEVNYFKGKGNLLLTGKLGDVMKESAQAALSFVRANASRFSISPTFFIENDIHVHVPEGAVPKDGPSAGITMSIAIISALTKRPIDCLVGLTGEVTIRGQILAIGGLKEKAIAAHRNGLKKIIIPKDNEKDIEDIPEEVTRELEILTATSVFDIIDVVLL